MNKTALLFSLILVLSAFAFSDPIPSACMTGAQPLSAYESLGATGCTVGGLVFSNFTFGASAAGAGAILPVDTGITVTPQTSTNNAGFLFDAALSPGSGQSQDVTIDYIVKVLAGSPSITDSALSVEASASGSSSASATMTECLGGLLPACAGGKSAGLMADATQLAVSNTFAAVSTVGTGTDISAKNGATISGELVQFSTGSGGSKTPEPASLFLFGTGVIGVAVLLRRKLSLLR